MSSGYLARILGIWETDEKTIVRLEIPALGEDAREYHIEKFYFPPQEFEIGQEITLTNEEYQEILRQKRMLGV